MNIKLLALDMDGTTLCSDHATLSPANCTAIEAAIAKGILVVIATGRMINRIPHAMDAIDGLRYYVTSNGAAVTDLVANRTLYSNPIEHDAAQRVLDALSGLPVYIEAYCNGNSYTDRQKLFMFEDFPLSPGRRDLMKRSLFPVDDFRSFLMREDSVIEKINLPYVPHEIQDEIWSRLRRVEGVSLTSSVVQNCEINNLSANKADGLLHLCKHLGIQPDEVMAMGDNQNDFEMMQFVGLSVAPDNATDQIKAVATHVTASNDDDGVAKAIQQFLL
ncbi:Cof-type HAD-IIB family hydrolase [Oscillospiraceae bacterium PP1C4]